MLDFTNALEVLFDAKNIIITTHVKPDGDAIGSALAMYYYLKALQKKVTIIIDKSKCPATFGFLHQSNQIKSYTPTKHDKIILQADAILVLDCSDLSRISEMADVVHKSIANKIVIDHHINPKPFPSLLYSDANAIATGELIYDFLIQAKAKITLHIAQALYTSIYTDSGGFRFNKTSSKTFQIAAELIRQGVAPDYMYENLYNLNQISKLHLQGMAMVGIETYYNGALSVMCITRKMFKQTKATSEDTEGLSQILLSIKESKVGIMICEYRGELRVSLRSKGDINVQQIATKHCGGGHTNAAGCKLYNTSIDSAKSMLIKEVEEILIGS